MKEIICIDDCYNPNVLEQFRIYNVVYPKRNEIYTIRDIVKVAVLENRIGLLLNEIINKPYPINHPILGKVVVEQSFNINRFSDLSGNILTKDICNKIINDNKIIVKESFTESRVE